MLWFKGLVMMISFSHGALLTSSLFFQALPMWAVYTGAVLVGLVVGSFLNVVIYRLPIMLEAQWQGEASPVNLMLPRSHCPQCKTVLRWYQNIPVVSFLLLRGRCRACGYSISPRYPVVEAITGLLFGVAAWRFGWSIAWFAVCLYISFSVCLSALDIAHHWLPDDLTQPLLWLGLFFNLYGTFSTLQDAVIGAMAGYGTLWLLYWVFKLLTKKEGLGRGDFKALGAVGAFCGWQTLPIVLLIASLLGLLYALWRVARGQQTYADPIPFGPSLLIGGGAALFGVNRWIEHLLMGGPL